MVTTLFICAAVAVVVLFGVLARSVDTDTAVFTGRAQVRVVVDRGSVDVVAESRVGIRVVTTKTGSLRRPHTSVSGDSGTLLLRGECSDPLGGLLPGACRVDYRIEVPNDTRIQIESNRGDLSAEGLRGTAELATRSGDIDVSELGGPLILNAATGSIRGEVTADDIEARAERGSVTIVAAHPPARLLAVSSTGDVDLRLPPATYALDAGTATGRVDSQVLTSLTSTHHIWAHSSSGDVFVGRDGP